MRAVPGPYEGCAGALLWPLCWGCGALYSVRSSGVWAVAGQGLGGTCPAVLPFTCPAELPFPCPAELPLPQVYKFTQAELNAMWPDPPCPELAGARDVAALHAQAWPHCQENGSRVLVSSGRYRDESGPLADHDAPCAPGPWLISTGLRPLFYSSAWSQPVRFAQMTMSHEGLRFP